MTNSDRLQEIRERVEKIQKKAILAENGQSIVVAHTFVSWGDFAFLLQLVTEQQREIEGLKHFADLYEQQNRAKGYRKQERPM